MERGGIKVCGQAALLYGKARSKTFSLGHTSSRKLGAGSAMCMPNTTGGGRASTGGVDPAVCSCRGAWDSAWVEESLNSRRKRNPQPTRSTIAGDGGSDGFQIDTILAGDSTRGNVEASRGKIEKRE